MNIGLMNQWEINNCFLHDIAKKPPIDEDDEDFDEEKKDDGVEFDDEDFDDDSDSDSNDGGVDFNED